MEWQVDGDKVYVKPWNTDKLFRSQRSWLTQDSTDIPLIWELANILLSLYKTARIVLAELKAPKCEQNNLECEQMFLISIYPEGIWLSDRVCVWFRLWSNIFILV